MPFVNLCLLDNYNEMEWLFLSPRKACHLLPKPFPKEPLLLELNNNGKVTEDKKKKKRIQITKIFLADSFILEPKKITQVLCGVSF